MTTDHFHHSLTEAREEIVEAFAYAHEFRNALVDLWYSELELAVEEVTTVDSVEKTEFSESGISPDSDIYFSIAAPKPTPWSIAFTPSFRKAMSTVDKKLQGRVLEAISELSEEPVTVQGDTKKPLLGKMKGLWRYRVGDYRLVYEPRNEGHLVVLLDFSARGTVYS